MPLLRPHDQGAALPLVLAALVISSLLSTALVGRVVTVQADVAARDAVRRRTAVLDGALRAAIAAGMCATSRWTIDGIEATVTCEVSEWGTQWETYRAEADGTSIEVSVQRDVDGAVRIAPRGSGLAGG